MLTVECTRCGEDCSNAYGTHYGYPYHFGCLPLSKEKPEWVEAEEAGRKALETPDA